MSSPGRRPLRWRLASRAFAVSLLAYPRPFRDRFGASMTEAFEDLLDRADAGPRPRGWTEVLLTLADTVRAGLVERVRPSTERESVATASVLTDLRIAVRGLLRRPHFTATAVGTLALGIGASAAVYSVVDAVLLSPLPFPEPDRLVMLWSHDQEEPTVRGWMSLPDLDDVRETGVLEAVEGWNPSSATVSGGDIPERIGLARTTGGVLDVFHLTPHLGRDLTRDDARPGAAPVVVVTHALWQQALGGRRDVVGTSFSLSEVAHEIVGVAPPDFTFPGVQAWAPLRHDLEGCGRACGIYQTVARLPPGAEAEVVNGRLAALGGELESTFPDTNTDKRFRVEALHDYQVGSVRSGLWILLAAVGLLLLIVCANLANLLLVRGSGRSREVALRAALGASRKRLLWQISAENVVLAFVGGSLGILISFGLVEVFQTLAPFSVPRLNQATPDATIILVMLGVSVVATLASGLSPALGLARRSTSSGLTSRGGGGSLGGSRLRGALVSAEIGLSVALIFGAGLLLRSLGELYHVDLGFHEREVVRFSVSLPTNRYEDLESIASFYRTLEERLAALPGVLSVGSIQGAPFAGGNVGGPVFVEGRPEPRPGAEPYASVRPVTPGYMETLGLRMIRGRGVQETDGHGTEPVAVVNERFVAEHFPEGDPLGARFSVTASYGYDSPTWTIVGVVADVRRSLTGQPIAELYVPHGQFGPAFMQVHLRSAEGTQTVLPRVREIMTSLDPAVPVTGVQTLRDAIRNDAAPVRFYLALLGSFAALAAVLATVGLYGVVAHVVGARRREIGIRMALGARRGEIHAMVFRWGGRHALLGLGAGLVACVAGSRYLASILFNVPPLDPVVLGAALLLVVATSTLAILVPARAAMNVDPSGALRAE